MEKALTTVPILRPHKDRAVEFMETIIAEAKDRNLIAHAIWKEFIPDTAEPTIAVRTVRFKRGSPQTVDGRRLSDLHLASTESASRSQSPQLPTE